MGFEALRIRVVGVLLLPLFSFRFVFKCFFFFFFLVFFLCFSREQDSRKTKKSS